MSDLKEKKVGMVASYGHLSVCSPTASNVSSGVEMLNVRIKGCRYHV